MQKENVVIVVKKDSVEHLAPSGRGWHVVPGEGVLTKEHFIGTPSSPLRGTSPARGEVNGGFTLIELLVVVLIIGILAAVALPQYKLAVEKSRATEIITQLKALAVAEQAYFLANGEYTNIPENLDLSFQDSVLGNKSITQDKVSFGFSRLTNDPPYIYGVLTDDSHADNNHQFFLNYVLTTGEIYCEVHNTATDLMKKVCKSFGSEAPCPKNNGTAATCYKAY